jgi:hypothetical protein
MAARRGAGDHAAIVERRLRNQLLTGPGPRRPGGVVRWFGAVQAQEYEAAKWAIGLRLPDGVGEDRIERAFGQGQILRTHVMRPTWHFVASGDIRWMLELTAPRVRRLMAPYDRRLELDPKTVSRGVDVVGRALRDGRHLTRAELRERLEKAGLAMSGQRLAHLVMHAELEAVVCSGPRREKRFTYALLAERAPRAERLSRDDALAELARRYFRSHGPATIRDFVWWSGLTVADTKRGLEMIRAVPEQACGRTYWTLREVRPTAGRALLAELLPIYDEYLVAYRDREAVPHAASAPAASPRADVVTFQNALMVGGQVAGTWRAARTSSPVALVVVPRRRLTAAERAAVEAATRRYARFLGKSVELSFGAPTRLPR